MLRRVSPPLNALAGEGNEDKKRMFAMNDLHGFTGPAWIGVDLDGTLAHYDGWKGATVIGDPIPKMLNRVLEWIEKGREVRIVTARVAPLKEDREECRTAIQKWLYAHVYPHCPVWFRDPVQIELVITHEKDQKMLELWDDRCVQVIPNTGERVDGKD